MAGPKMPMPNTAFSQSVTPLPFHAMSAYPYKANEQFPNDAEHAAIRARLPDAPSSAADPASAPLKSRVASDAAASQFFARSAGAILLVNSALLAAFPTRDCF